MAYAIESLKTALSAQYDIASELGIGGMATVYLAQDLKHDRQVAVKVLRPEIASVLGPERFLREIRVTAQLQHPHALPLLDSGDADGFLYYVMPFVDGETLRDRLNREKQLSIDDTIKITLNVADALDAAHERGIIHRDIKPENILLGRGHAMVADFGIARAVSAVGEERLTETGMAVGTPHYMSPEQASADAVTERSDLYALACVVHEMLVGEPPFGGRTADVILRQHMVAPPPNVSVLRPGVPTHISKALEQALSKTPTDRQESALAFAHEISRVARDGGTTPSQRRWLGVVAAIAVLLVLFLLGSGFLGQGSSPEANRVMVLPFENRTGDSDFEAVGELSASWITRMIDRYDIAAVVPTSVVLESHTALPESRTTIAKNSLALQHGASTVVTGFYRRIGDQIRLTFEIINVADDELIASREVSRSATDPEGLVFEVGQYALGAVATLHDKAITDQGLDLSAPTNYIAFRAFAAAREVAMNYDFNRALIEYQRAIDLDPNFFEAILQKAMIHGNLSRGTADDTTKAVHRQIADSLIQAVEDSSHLLTAYQVTELEAQRASWRGDALELYRARRKRAELAPTSQRDVLNWGISAINVNRTGEALKALETIDAAGRFGNLREYWNNFQAALHAAERYDDELAVARRAIERHPNGPSFAWLAPPLIGLAAWDAIDSLIDGAEHAIQPPVAWTAIIEELLSHGRADLVTNVSARIVRWIDEDIARAEAYPFQHGYALMHTGRVRAAVQVFADYYARTGSLAELYAAMAARAGDSTTARTISGLLPESERRMSVIQRAVVAAALGDQATVHDLISRLADRRLNFFVYHKWLAFSELRELPAFHRILGPVG